MRDVFLLSDTTDYEDIHALELFNGLFRYAVCVGKVAQSAETESEYREPVMYGADGDDLHSVDIEWMLVYGVEDEVRHSGIAVVSECIGVFSFERFLDTGFGIYGETFVHEVIVCPDIIQPAGVVLVHMGEKHRVKFLYPAPEHLLPEIRACVDYQSEPLVFYVGGSSESLVAEVVGAAYFAVASYHGHALGGTCAQKFYFVGHSTPKIGIFA